MTGFARRPSGWVLYDGDCTFCAGLARRFDKPLRVRGFGLSPLQAPWVRERLGTGEGEPSEMIVLTGSGRTLGGARAVAHLARNIGWARPLAWLAALPGGFRLLDAAYRRIARHRHRLARASRAR